MVNLPSKFQMRQLQESVRVLEREQVALINVPVPEFEDTDPADIVHDFERVRAQTLPTIKLCHLPLCYSQPIIVHLLLLHV